MSASSDPKQLSPTGSPLRLQRKIASARPRALTNIESLPRSLSLADDVVINAPVTPRNQLAAVIHRERLEIAPRSPRSSSSPLSTSASAIPPADPQDSTSQSTSATNSMSAIGKNIAVGVDRQRELFNPPAELPDDVSQERIAAIVADRSRRRQERAAKEIQNAQKSRVAETSTGVTKVIAYNLDNIDSDSDSDDFHASEVRFYPFDVTLENKKQSPRQTQTQPQAQAHQTKQRHSLDVETVEDILSNSDDGDTANDDSDTIDDCEQTLKPLVVAIVQQQQQQQPSPPQRQENKPNEYAQAMDERVRAKNDFVIMQTVLTGKSCCFDFAKVYDTIWYGLKPPVREQFWMSQLASQSGGATEDIELPTFEGLIANGRITRLCYDEIIKDLYRAYPFISRYRPDIHRQTYRALTSYAIYRPDIGYVQGMTHIYMTILIVLPHQEQQFRMMEHITRRILPYHYDTDMVGVRIDGAVLAAYMRLRCRKLTEFYEKEFQSAIENLTFEIAVVWFLRLFVQVLQGSQLLRIWDMLMLRGPVTLIQFTLQILNYAYKREIFLKQSNYLEFITTMTQHLRGLESIDSILKTRLADKHIPIEDFDLRRRSATRIQLATLAQQTQQQHSLPGPE